MGEICLVVYFFNEIATVSSTKKLWWLCNNTYAWWFTLLHHLHCTLYELQQANEISAVQILTGLNMCENWFSHLCDLSVYVTCWPVSQWHYPHVYNIIPCHGQSHLDHSVTIKLNHFVSLNSKRIHYHPVLSTIIWHL